MLKVLITKKLILSVKHLHAKYQAGLEVKRKLAEQEVACKRQLEEMNKGEKKRNRFSKKVMKVIQRSIWRKVV